MPNIFLRHKFSSLEIAANFEQNFLDMKVCALQKKKGKFSAIIFSNCIFPPFFFLPSPPGILIRHFDFSFSLASFSSLWSPNRLVLGSLTTGLHIP